MVFTFYEIIEEMRPVTCQCSKVLSVEDLAPSHSRAQCVCVCVGKTRIIGRGVGRRASHRSSHVSHISLKSSMSPAPAYLGLGLIAAVSIGLIIYAHARPAPEPLAPISVWYEVPTCSNATASASAGQHERPDFLPVGADDIFGDQRHSFGRGGENRKNSHKS